MSHLTRARRVLAAVAVAGTATAALLAAAPGASAVARAAYDGACGSGYTVVNSAPVGDEAIAYPTCSRGRDPRQLRQRHVPVVRGPLYLSAKGQFVDRYGRLDGVSFGESGTNCG
ncbi:spore-associated protein A [Streptomyces dangxiongensis]|uniref:spore-associated protein A n=1 Tax=Streptomyces dangxiongensis TaxID=1442032 RepID=UPI001F095210|nr:spore-associated protein A [Streptomyces dangxiongensis]